MKTFALRLCLLLGLAAAGTLLGSAWGARPGRERVQRGRHAPPVALPRDAVGALVKADHKFASHYRGTSIGPHQKAQGNVLDLHNRLAAEFARVDPQPPSRAAHYAWIKDEIDPDYAIQSWSGLIVDTTPDGEDWIVTINVRPVIHSAKTRVGVLPSRNEVYRYVTATKTFFFLDADAIDPNQPHVWTSE